MRSVLYLNQGKLLVIKTKRVKPDYCIKKAILDNLIKVLGRMPRIFELIS